MTATTRTASASDTSPPITRPSPTATEHYSIPTNTSQEHERQATRSRDSHLCITIPGCGQAFGLPRIASNPVDLHKIVSGWFGC